MSVSVTIQHVQDCPGPPVARERVEAAAAQLGLDLEVELVRVDSVEDAARLGFTGSPTILVDGVDPFATPGAGPAMACRLYAGPAGLDVSPTVQQLLAALRQRRRR